VAPATGATEQFFGFPIVFLQVWSFPLFPHRGTPHFFTRGDHRYRIITDIGGCNNAIIHGGCGSPLCRSSPENSRCHERRWPTLVLPCLRHELTLVLPGGVAGWERPAKRSEESRSLWLVAAKLRVGQSGVGNCASANLCTSLCLYTCT